MIQRLLLASPTFTGTVSGITKSMVGLGKADNTTDVNKPISSATQGKAKRNYNNNRFKFKEHYSIRDNYS